MKKSIITTVILSVCSSAVVAHDHDHSAGTDEHALTTTFEYQGKPATKATIAANKAFAKTLDFNNTKGFEETRKGLIAEFDETTAAIIWNDYRFLEGKTPDTVNPSLWRQGQVNHEAAGLYQVSDKIFQVRGTDLANMSLVRGETGWIILDPLTTPEAAEASLRFALNNLPEDGDLPVVAMIYSHSHGDHFGGARGIQKMFPDVVAYGSKNITKEIVDENVLAGNAMSRRVSYQYGTVLPIGETGIVDAALSNAVTKGELSYVKPIETNHKADIESWTIDGLEFIFMDASGTEATSEAVAYIPSMNAIWAAELTYKGMHNIYTLRGAKTRDALLWSKKINEVITEFGGEADVLFAAHSAPIWGNEDLNDFLKLQRDNYGFVHNQSLRLANNGVVMQDIGWEIQNLIPETIQSAWHTNGYHGTYSHNARAVYNLYLGYFDMNPANLNPLPTQAEAAKFVEYMGGCKAVLTKAQGDFDKGEYNFVATAMNKVVTACPELQQGRDLLADTYEQQGYQSEGAGWRNVYLSGAYELRHGIQETVLKGNSADVISEMDMGMILDYLAVQVDASVAQHNSFTMNIVLPDINETYYVEMSNGNLNNIKVTKKSAADATFTINKEDVDKFSLQQVSIAELLKTKQASLQGDQTVIQKLAKSLTQANPSFKIVP
ncbi:alkyl/aryl-sulfatase [Shewanella sp. 6_MG-2023]|uniref:alkyl/aryl-sulfatase n=1 Tax=Shewanella sp. 6_MG-2023 TaxID=3062660 RepID=UPI0026E2518A|nr:alkyl sulfatase dimerization domain-containing protein [Shewanella sp. 6_MG-2023]MDO6620628.1 alkyl sulfatase dimerization domain-containing protein [Shewanella sp. 6_MG-2023]